MRQFLDLPVIGPGNCPPEFALVDRVDDCALLDDTKNILAVVLSPQVFSADIRALFATNALWPLPKCGGPYHAFMGFQKQNGAVRPAPCAAHSITPDDFHHLLAGAPVNRQLWHEVDQIGTGIMQALPHLQRGTAGYAVYTHAVGEGHVDDAAVVATVGLNVGGAVLIRPRPGFTVGYPLIGGIALDDLLQSDSFDAYRLPPSYVAVMRGASHYGYSAATPHADHPMPVRHAAYADRRQWIRWTFEVR